MWVLAVPYFALYAVGLSYTLWAPILVRDALGTSNASTGLIVGAISLLSALVYPRAALLSDRWDERCGLCALALGLYCAGCIGLALFPHSLLRVTALMLIPLSTPLFMSPFWCLPTKFLKGTSAAAGIALISAIGSSGGFFGPSIVGFLKQKTGGDAGAFFGLAALAFIGSLVLIGLRQLAVFKPSQRFVARLPRFGLPSQVRLGHFTLALFTGAMESKIGSLQGSSDFTIQCLPEWIAKLSLKDLACVLPWQLFLMKIVSNFCRSVEVDSRLHRPSVTPHLG